MLDYLYECGIIVTFERFSIECKHLVLPDLKWQSAMRQILEIRGTRFIHVIYSPCAFSFLLIQF